MKNWLFWEVVIPSTLAVTLLRGLTLRRRLARQMAGREPRTSEEFGRHFFPAGQAEVAARLRELLAEYAPVELSRLAPDDRLVQGAGVGVRDGLEPTLFVQDVEREYGIQIPDAAAERLMTLRDFVDFIAQARGAGAGAA